MPDPFKVRPGGRSHERRITRPVQRELVAQSLLRVSERPDPRDRYPRS